MSVQLLHFWRRGLVLFSSWNKARPSSEPVSEWASEFVGSEKISAQPLSCPHWAQQKNQATLEKGGLCRHCTCQSLRMRPQKEFPDRVGWTECLTCSTCLFIYFCSLHFSKESSGQPLFGMCPLDMLWGRAGQRDLGLILGSYLDTSIFSSIQ